MNENSVFEINDFTIVTDMEHFGATFEGILQKFDKFGRRPFIPDDVSYQMSVSDSTVISIGQNKLVIELLQPTVSILQSESTLKKTSEIFDEKYVPPFAAIEEIGSHRNGFESNDELTLKFGIRECIVISPTDCSCTLTDESQTNTILGTIKSVLHLTKCEIPVLCYIKDKHLNIIEGYASDGNAAIKFSSVVLRSINRRNCSMNDLLNLFKEHLGVSTSAFHNEVRISSRFSQEFLIDTNEYFRIHTLDSLKTLASGPISHLPLTGFQISATWRFFRENSLTENHSHSDFDIKHSSYWNIKTKCAENSLLGVFDEILGVYAEDRRKAIKTNLNCKKILGKHYSHNERPNAFQKLTSHNASEVQFGDKVILDTGTSGPISPELIRAWSCSIFDEDSAKEQLSHELNLINASNISEKQLSTIFFTKNEILTKMFNFTSAAHTEKFLASYKAAKKGSITWKLATALANSRIIMNNEPRAEPQLWIEFLLCLRKKYDNMETVETVDGGIDHMQCAFSQKIQMLQLCIEARRKRKILLDDAHSSVSEEYFDANETLSRGDQTKIIAKSICEGRLKQTSLALIGNPEMKMFVPVTQEACPLTDEMIDAQNEKLLSLTENDRANVQMELVKSDMQSFKAANPGAVFADFLRWHSPKDYDETTGKISDRMLISDNIWVRSWKSAPAIPAVNQARIFNDTKIAEEIFEQFENATLDQVREWMKPTTFAAVLERLTEVESTYGISEEKMNQRRKTAQVLANATLNDSEADYDKIIKYCSQVEMVHNLRVNLFYLFETAKEMMQLPHPSEKEIQDTIKNLVNLTVSNIWKTSDEKQFIVKPQEPIGRAIATMCNINDTTEQQSNYKNQKEYIFTWNLKRPSNTTLSTIHRMYANLKTDNHSLYFSVSNDSNFFNKSFL